jgi:LysM repeat protein
MSTLNPFQVPSCLQRDLQQRRQKRFQKIVIASVATAAALMVALLIAGCMSDHAKVSTGVSDETAQFESNLVAAAPKPLPPAPSQPAISSLTPMAIKPSAPPVATAAESVYVVKSGDTLSRIARLCRTSVRALKAANGLDNDMLTVGLKLKLPTA